ncbi:hypothetical protein QR680_011683 [Steinernema hermaphroditum]|uniref:non-specific serine/threonine protein kinase n=1 Tax=Steinernema hermaphroditum TaxID=289476 RepID=A0AA39LZF1_9BILA|nr:hypothetical protein QR680_011683 [Steinernema hermaphroditum]
MTIEDSKFHNFQYVSQVAKLPTCHIAYRYHVIRELGWGAQSAAWLCWDTKDQRFVAMKIVKSADSKAALYEMKLLRSVCAETVNGRYRDRVVQMYDEFQIEGPNGTHVCMVLEVLGRDLRKLMIENNGTALPLSKVRVIARQVLGGLHHLHENHNIAHNDIHTGNVLVTMSQSQNKELVAEVLEWANTRVKVIEQKVTFLDLGFIVFQSWSNSMQQNDEQPSTERVEDSDRLQNAGANYIDCTEKQKRPTNLDLPNANGVPANIDKFPKLHSVMKMHRQLQELTKAIDAAAKEHTGEEEINVKIADLGNAHCVENATFDDDLRNAAELFFEVATFHKVNELKLKSPHEKTELLRTAWKFIGYECREEDVLVIMSQSQIKELVAEALEWANTRVKSSSNSMQLTC